VLTHFTHHPSCTHVNACKHTDHTNPCPTPPRLLFSKEPFLDFTASDPVARAKLLYTAFMILELAATGSSSILQASREALLPLPAQQQRGLDQRQRALLSSIAADIFALLQEVAQEHAALLPWSCKQDLSEVSCSWHAMPFAL
jgi:hypothetical protein